MSTAPLPGIEKEKLAGIHKRELGHTFNFIRYQLLRLVDIVEGHEVRIRNCVTRAELEDRAPGPQAKLSQDGSVKRQLGLLSVRQVQIHELLQSVMVLAESLHELAGLHTAQLEEDSPEIAEEAIEELAAQYEACRQAMEKLSASFARGSAVRESEPRVLDPDDEQRLSACATLVHGTDMSGGRHLIDKETMEAEKEKLTEDNAREIRKLSRQAAASRRHKWQDHDPSLGPPPDLFDEEETFEQEELPTSAKAVRGDD